MANYIPPSRAARFARGTSHKVHEGYSPPCRRRSNDRNNRHKTVLNEFHRVAFRKKLYASIADLRNDLDPWISNYNEETPHQGRRCFGKTPVQTFRDAIPIAKKK